MRIHITVLAGDDVYFETYLDPVYRKLPSEAIHNQVWNTIRLRLEAEFGKGVKLVDGPRPDTFSINVDGVER